MKTDFSLAHLSMLECSPVELIEVAAAAGYDSVNLRLTAAAPDAPNHPLTSDRQLLKQTQKTLAATGIRVHDVELVRLSPETEPEECRPILRTASALGAETVIVQLPDHDHQRATDRFADICEMAEQYELTACLEFPPWTATGNLLAADTILSAVGKKNSSLLVDILYFNYSWSSIELLKSLPKQWFKFIRISDAFKPFPKTIEGFKQLARANRLFPGEGDLGILELVNNIEPSHYSLKVPNSKRLRMKGRQEYARQALLATRQLLGLSTANC